MNLLFQNDRLAEAVGLFLGWLVCLYFGLAVFNSTLVHFYKLLNNVTTNEVCLFSCCYDARLFFLAHW
jgi:hypothetical protein